MRIDGGEEERCELPAFVIDEVQLGVSEPVEVDLVEAREVDRSWTETALGAGGRTAVLTGGVEDVLLVDVRTRSEWEGLVIRDGDPSEKMREVRATAVGDGRFTILGRPTDAIDTTTARSPLFFGLEGLMVTGRAVT